MLNLLNAMDDYFLLYDSNGTLIYHNHEEIPSFKKIEHPFDMKTLWYQNKNKFYQFSEQIIKNQGKNYILCQYHENTQGYYELIDFMLDDLTQIPTRKIINKYLDKLSKNPENAVFILMDIDHFKQINDHYGHEYADQIITEIGSVLNSNRIPNFFFGRYGGEEFLIIIKQKNIQEVLDMVKQLKEKLETHFNNIIHEPIYFSFGMANHGKNDTLSQTIRATDEALYFVKENGRNNIAYYDNSSNIILANPIEKRNER